MMTVSSVDLTACDREPIHVPGAIQPHGLLLVVNRASGRVEFAAGDIETRLGRPDWRGAPLADIIGDELARSSLNLTDNDQTGGYVGLLTQADGGTQDVTAHLWDDHVLVEIEPGTAAPVPAALALGALETAGRALERASNLTGLCERAATEFARLTGYDRVMIYRFLDDNAGVVIAEHAAEGVEGFLNHHFPSTDIPKQARALYVRNLVRVIPDIDYQPAPLRPDWTAEAPLDMSDCALRSVSPVHIQYLKNMGIKASASVSIVKDGVLWGLVACHNRTPRLLPFDVRAACRALAGGLARQIKAREEADDYRERVALRGLEDEILRDLAGDERLDDAIDATVGKLRRVLGGDGLAVYRGGRLVLEGTCPAESAVREMVGWLVEAAANEPFRSDRWGERDERARPFKALASGVLAVTVSTDEPFMLIWFRAERLQVLNWAGNPHKAVSADDGALTPRASFDAWAETVSGIAAPWSPAEIEVAGRLRNALREARHHRRLKDLNTRLGETLADRECLLSQKDFLLREVNHRVQNSLQLVSSFLGLQGRASDQPEITASLEEARRRLGAVALVHRRLYHADNVENVDLGRYLEELTDDMVSSMGEEWAGRLTVTLAPVTVPTDRAVTIGLVLTELIINARKYAYDGAPGPLEVALEQDRAGLRLIVADRGRGKTSGTSGFGSRMMAAMVSQLQGELIYQDNGPGLRSLLVAPLTAR